MAVPREMFNAECSGELTRAGSSLELVPIPGTMKLNRLEENLGAATVELTPEDLRDIEGARYPEQLEQLTGR